MSRLDDALGDRMMECLISNPDILTEEKMKQAEAEADAYIQEWKRELGFAEPAVGDDDGAGAGADVDAGVAERGADVSSDSPNDRDDR